MQRVPNRNGFEVWRQLVAETHQRQRVKRVEDSRCCKRCCSREWMTIRQSLRKRAKRGNIKWTSTRISRRRSRMRAIIHAHLNTNKSWIANDFRNDTNESGPMEVDHIGNGKRQYATNKRQETRSQEGQEGKEGKEGREGSPTNKKQSATLAERKGIPSVTVGHEQTKTEQRTNWKVQRWTPMERMSLCWRLRTS